MRTKFILVGTLIIAIGLTILTLSVAREKKVVKTTISNLKVKKEQLNLEKHRSISKKLNRAQAQSTKRDVVVSKDLKVKAHFKN